MKRCSVFFVLFCAIAAHAQCNTKIGEKDRVADVQNKLDCLVRENEVLKRTAAPEKLPPQFIALLDQFPASPTPSPYSFFSYNNDLQALANLLRGFVAYFQSNPKASVSASQSALFFSAVLMKADIARVRARQVPNDQFYVVHCRDNFANFELVLDEVELDLNRASDGRLPSDQIAQRQQEISDWLDKAVVTPGTPKP